MAFDLDCASHDAALKVKTALADGLQDIVLALLDSHLRLTLKRDEQGELDLESPFATDLKALNLSFNCDLRKPTVQPRLADPCYFVVFEVEPRSGETNLAMMLGGLAQHYLRKVWNMPYRHIVWAVTASQCLLYNIFQPGAIARQDREKTDATEDARVWASAVRKVAEAEFERVDIHILDDKGGGDLALVASKQRKDSLIMLAVWDEQAKNRLVQLFKRHIHKQNLESKGVVLHVGIVGADSDQPRLIKFR